MLNGPASGFIPALNRKPPPQAPDKKTPPQVVANEGVREIQCRGSQKWIPSIHASN
ncbi:hypothetical protein MAE02_70960 [Microvirga aerophila]|uniref:Uncharacterized protein n=1 Tax=Microvirga aerophila TaxID=670291 RepID=A0A512C5G1_9HYPH|nr:hypothetical protein MAE02_70960 [Microvirga aerophila]